MQDKVAVLSDTDCPVSDTKHIVKSAARGTLIILYQISEFRIYLRLIFASYFVCVSELRNIMVARRR